MRGSPAPHSYAACHPPPSRAAKLLGFFCLRACLGLASAATEAWLYRAVAARCRPAVARCLLLFLCSAAGLFAASTALLPSTFSMYAMTAAAAAVLEGRPFATIAAAVIGEQHRCGVGWGWGKSPPWEAALPWMEAANRHPVCASPPSYPPPTRPISAAGVVWGWCVAGAAFLPYALWVLAAAPLVPAVGALALWLAATLGPLVLVDRHFYGSWTVCPGRRMGGRMGGWYRPSAAAWLACRSMP